MHSEMPVLWVTNGHFTTFFQHAAVWCSSHSSMPNPVQMMDTHYFNPMKSGILLPTSWQKFAIMWLLNHTSNSWLVKTYMAPPPSQMLAPDLMLQQINSWAADISTGNFFMYGFSTHTFPKIRDQCFNLRTKNKSRREPRTTESER